MRRRRGCGDGAGARCAAAALTPNGAPNSLRDAKSGVGHAERRAATPATKTRATTVVFPLYDENPLKKPVKPYVTWALILLNVAVFLCQIGSSEEAQRAMLATFAVVPAALTRDVTVGMLPPEATLITSMF